MFDNHAHADPPLTLSDRVRHLNDSLQHLALRVRDAIASAVSRAVGDAIRDVVRALLGEKKERLSYREEDPFDEPTDRREWDDQDEDPWREAGHQNRVVQAPIPGNNSRWQEAIRAATQAGLWWLKQQPGKRPLLTTTLVALVAGSAAFVAGPAFAAFMSVAATVASLLLTADSARSLAGLFSR